MAPTPTHPHAAWALLALLAFIAFLACSVSTVNASSLLVSSSGYSLNNAPLLLDGVNVGAGLAEAAQEIAALQQTIRLQQAAIDQLTAKVNALLTPTIVAATAGDSEADVRWALSAATVTAVPGGATCTTNGLGGERACKVTGLTNGQSYTFTARLTNGAGMGDISPPSNPVTPGPQCRLLTLSAEGSGTLTATPPNSVGCPASSFTPGARILLAASPAAGFTLASWGGSLPGPTELQWQWDYTMPDSAAEQTATFAQCHSLAVELVGGGSAVSERVPSASAGCPAGFHIAGETVVLSLTAYNGAFAGWQAPVSSSDNPLVYRMPAGDATLVAAVRACYHLQLSSSGGGSVTALPTRSGGCPEGYYAGGASITLNATAHDGFIFKSWTGAVSSSIPTPSFSMPSASASVQAAFLSLRRTTTATAVLGQPDFTSTGTTMAPYTLGFPGGLAVDVQNNLYVSDVSSNRVVVYAPDAYTPFRVLGQENFTGVEQNRGLGFFGARADSMFQPIGLTLDDAGGLYVADFYNSRVLFFEPGADTATRVYGQGGIFTTNGPNLTPNYLSDPGDLSADSLYYPVAIVLTPARDGLHILDQKNNRILYYPGTSTTALRVIGQPDFVTGAPGFGPDKLNGPSGLAIDGSGGLWVGDSNNHRVLYFPAGSSTASRVLGQPDFTYVDPKYPSGLPSASNFNFPRGVALDLAGGLYVADFGSNRALYFEPNATEAVTVWGQADSFETDLLNLGATEPDASSLAMPYFTPVLDRKNRLFISDFFNNRVLRYDVIGV